MFENRRYVRILKTDINKINFAEVFEDSPDTCRYSLDGSQTFVSYDLPMPPSVDKIRGKSKEYNHDDFLKLLQTPAWTPYRKNA